MCGAAGIVGNVPAQGILFNMIVALKMRGYDSAGIVVAGETATKVVGEPEQLQSQLSGNNTSTIGIAHNRWATHGEPNVGNAHPHVDASGKLWLVHNGTIDNFRDIRARLSLPHYSDTDTEVFAKLIGSHYAGDLHAAVVAACREVQGTYGIIAMHEDHPDELVTACLGSPIVLGRADGYNLIASDQLALAPHTRSIIPLEDGDSAIVRQDKIEIFKEDGEAIDRPAYQLGGDVAQISKGGYPHFMRYEIANGPKAICDTIRGRLLLEAGNAKLGGLSDYTEQLAKLKRLTIVGCGSAYYAGLVGAWMIEQYAGIPTQNRLGSDYHHRNILENGDSAVLAVSQSGTTMDTLMSVKHARAHHLLTLGIVNVVGSQIARATDAGVYNHAGPEIAVASTKAVLSQMTVFALITLMLARERGMSEAEGRDIVEALQALPKTLEAYLKDTHHIESLARKYERYDSMMYIGQGSHEPIAHESALKMREVATIDAWGIAAGELKHGSIALLSEHYPVVALAPHGDKGIYDLVCTNIEQCKARKAPVLAVGTEGDTMLAQIANDVLYVPEVHPLLQPIISVVPMQLLAYYVGVKRGVNVDQPPNLAKTVTTA